MATPEKTDLMTEWELIKALSKLNYWDHIKINHLIQIARLKLLSASSMQLHLEELLEFSCKKYGVTKEQARSKTQALLPVLCRIDFIHRAYRETECKSHEIGQVINRTGSTVRFHLSKRGKNHE